MCYLHPIRSSTSSATQQPWTTWRPLTWQTSSAPALAASPTLSELPQMAANSGRHDDPSTATILCVRRPRDRLVTWKCLKLGMESAPQSTETVKPPAPSAPPNKTPTERLRKTHSREGRVCPTCHRAPRITPPFLPPLSFTATPFPPEEEGLQASSRPTWLLALPRHRRAVWATPE